MQVAYCSDIHGEARHWRTLLEQRVDAIIGGGDILPKRGHFEELLARQKRFIRSFLTSALSETSAPVYLMLGNDDFATTRPALDDLARQSARRKRGVHLIDGALHRLGDHELIGLSLVPVTPFSVKDFERLDSSDAPLLESQFQAYVSSGGKLREVVPAEYFASVPTLEEELAQLPSPTEMSQAIYVMHAPPYGTNLDVLYDGRHIGSRAIRHFIEAHQPYLTLHGHIHESPAMSGSYVDRIGRTLCINPGQGMQYRFHFVTFDLNDVAGTLTHSVYVE